MGRSSIPGMLIAFTVLVAALLLAFTLGRYPISVGELLHVFAAKLTGRASETPTAAVNVILEIRGPRVLAAVLIGAVVLASNALILSMIELRLGITPHSACRSHLLERVMHAIQGGRLMGD
jgi:ABC-type enterobactin transport system permease subunit